MEIIFIIGSVQALFFSFLIFSKRRKNSSDLIMGAWLVFLAIHLVFPFLMYRNYPGNLALIGYDIGFFILHAVFLFSYTKFRTNIKPLKKKNFLINIIPVILVYVFLYPFLSLDYKTKIGIYNGKIEIPGTMYFNFIIVYIIFISYLIITIYALNRHKKNILNNFSAINKIDLIWLKNLTHGLLIVYCLSFLLTPFIFLSDIPPIYLDYPLYLYLVIFVYGIGYFGYKQGEIFSYSIEEQHKPKAKTSIKPEDQQFSIAFNRIMKDDKHYLDNELSLHNLAQKLNSNAHYLSHILNNIIKKNFYDFVNGFRVDEVKERLKNGEGEKRTLLYIALDSGFNSKASFNRIFKQNTGKTPSQYIRTEKI